MRCDLEPRVRRWWAGEGGAGGAVLSLATLPLGLVYRGVIAARNLGFDQGWRESEAVEALVVSVGNLTVGGTGKTPVTAWLAAELAGWGRTPAVVARGYGEDELRLHRRWNPAIPVHADPDRVRAARQAVAGGADALVLDDAFQHRRLKRDVDLVILSAEQPFPGRLLPRGPYREPPAALRRADAVLVTRRVADDEAVERLVARVGERAPGMTVGVLDLVPDGWTDLEGAPAEAPRGEILAVTAVGQPEAFAALVARETDADPELIPFPDHHEFDAGDVDRIVRAAGPRTIAVTEKDAVKLARFARTLPPTRVLTLRVRPGPGTNEVLARVRAGEPDRHRGAGIPGGKEGT